MNNNENSMELLNNVMDNLTTTALETLKSENIGGVDTVFFEFSDTVKDEEGKDKIITRKVTNPALVASFTKIQTIDMLSKYSTTILAFELSKLTKEQAEMYKCKNIMDLIYKVFPKLTIDRTTATKYRKAGLLFMDRTKDKIGCEFPFTRIFYKFRPLRSADEIISEINHINDRIHI